MWIAGIMVAISAPGKRQSAQFALNPEVRCQSSSRRASSTSITGIPLRIG